MADVLSNAVGLRIRLPVEPVVLEVGSARVSVPADRIAALVNGALGAERSYLAGRARFRREFSAVVTGLAAESRTLTNVSGDEVARALRSTPAQRIWPAVSPTEIVRELLGNQELMRRASDGILDDSERAILYRERQAEVRDEPWSVGDIALIDEADSLLRGAVSTYGYVVVDEAQDLTPMQLRMVFRRSTGSRATLVGDLAQSTGPWRYRSWEALFEFLSRDSQTRIAELALSYRVPRQVMDLANELVPRIAPDVMVPRAVRPSPDGPRLVKVPAESVPQTMAREVSARLDADRTVAVIVAGDALASSRATLEDAGISVGEVRADGLSKLVTLLSADAAKGLEFDHVIVVDPDAIIGPEQDWARLYVALTRPTRSLSVIHTSDTPIPVERVPLPEPAEPPPPPPAKPEIAEFEPLGPRFTEALMQAKFLHVRQQRRGTSVPYFAHLQAVCALVLEDGGSEDEAIAALLHDAAEDYGADVLDRIAEQFGPAVAEIVAGCTDPDQDEGRSWRDVKRQHIADLEQAGPLVRRVALAEKLDNARALLRDYRKFGSLLWERMDVEADDLLWYMSELADLFAAERPGDMASELQGTVEQLLDAATV
jgi:hypothetical protein